MIGRAERAPLFRPLVAGGRPDTPALVKARPRAVARLRQTPGFAPLVGAISLCSLHASAAANDDESSTWIDYEPPATERRGGFTMGLSLGAGIGSAYGYPLEASALEDPSLEASTGTTVPFAGALWFGGSYRDWLTVALGAEFGAIPGSGNLGQVFAAFLRIEAYPLYFLGGHYRDLGLSFQGGAGAANIVDGASGEVVADGGAPAFLGLGAFYEPIHFWHIRSGPFLSYDQSFSQTLKTHQILLGFRFSFYGTAP